MKLQIGLLACAIVLGAGSQVVAGEPPFWPCESNDGAPFGHLSDSDANQLVSFAAANGLDLVPTLEKLYAGDKEALATVFRLSSQLTSRNMPMRVYGNMMHSIFLNLGENKGLDQFISVMLSQEPAVLQRVRDFLWYPMFCVPQEHRAEVGNEIRADLPLLFPQSFEFGKKDNLFSKTPNNPIKQSVRPVTPLAKSASGAPARSAAYRVRWTDHRNQGVV